MLCEVIEIGCESGLEVVGGIWKFNFFVSEVDESGKNFYNDLEIELNGND